jgi:hypothetical protein
MILNKVNIVIEIQEVQEVQEIHEVHEIQDENEENKEKGEKEEMFEEKVITEDKSKKLQNLKEIANQNNETPEVQIESGCLSPSPNYSLTKLSKSFEEEENKNELLDPEQKSNVKLDNQIEMAKIDDQIETTEIEEGKEEKAIGFWKAWLLPGVIPFAI